MFIKQKQSRYLLLFCSADVEKLKGCEYFWERITNHVDLLDIRSEVGMNLSKLLHNLQHEKDLSSSEL